MEEKRRYMNRFGDRIGASRWINQLHARWKEWSDPGASNLPLSVEDIVKKGLKRSPPDAKRIVAENNYAKKILEQSALAKKSIIATRR